MSRTSSKSRNLLAVNPAFHSKKGDGCKVEKLKDEEQVYQVQKYEVKIKEGN
jgi:hypothetical protein